MTVAKNEPGTARKIVHARISELQQGYLNNRADSVTALARLRHAVGKPPGSVLDILEHTLADEFTRDWNSDDASYAEVAAHHAMTLYALHQQSIRTIRMHQPGRRLGHQIRALHPGEKMKPTDPIPKRFAMLGTSDELSEVLHHLRGLVQLLRGAKQPLDYAQLADELITWQHRGGPDRVRLAWGRDFHLTPKKASQDAKTEKPESEQLNPDA